MKISTLNLLLVDASKNLIRNKAASFASIGSVISALLLIGLFWLCLLNFRIGMLGVYSQFEIKVILKDGINIKDQQNVYNKIKAANVAVDITFENDTSPASYTVKAGEDDINNIISQINGLQGISEIHSEQKLPVKILVISKIIQLGGAVLFLLLLAASFFIIKNTMKAAIYSRRSEICIMRYVGASDWFIKWPFIFEGIIIGFLGAVSAVFVIYCLYTFIYMRVTPYLTEIPVNFINPSFISTTILWSFILIGIIQGALGSFWGLRKL